MLEQLRRPVVIVPAIAVIAFGSFVLRQTAEAPVNSAAIAAKVKSGDFRVVVSTTGELRARKFVQIQGPPNMQQAGAFQTRISSLVPEGTVVKAGDMVAELDRSGVAAKFQEVSLALQKAD